MLRNFARENNLDFVVGMDEVGRGPLAGPVVTAAVCLPPEFESELIVDSKQICKSKTKMKEAYDLILENAYSVTCEAVSATVINDVGIEEVTWQCMDLCLNKMNVPIDHVLVDGNRYVSKYDNPYTTVVKGDSTYLSIAAASIVAKYRRDEYMEKIHKIHPHYGFITNKGYFSKIHGNGILEHGMCRYHRTQFVESWLKKQKK